MNKARKMVVGLLMVFGAVSVSFGYGMFEEDEAMYQKLKAELEEVVSLLGQFNIDIDESKCFKEDGSPTYENGVGYELQTKERVCRYKNVLAFVDEYRKIDAKSVKSGYGAYNKVKQIPRFKTILTLIINNP